MMEEMIEYHDMIQNILNDVQVCVMYGHNGFTMILRTLAVLSYNSIICMTLADDTPIVTSQSQALFNEPNPVSPSPDLNEMLVEATYKTGVARSRSRGMRGGPMN